MARCLVTGGSGFIGSHLVARLAELGHEVYVFDVLPPPVPYKLPNIWWDLRDITRGSLFEPFCRLADWPRLKDWYSRCDWLFHLAAKADVIPSIEKPLNYHRVNVGGTANMLNAAVKLGVKRFIYASSTSIYGIPKGYPTPETAPADPQYPYALTKYLAELAVMHWGKVYHLPVLSLRITTAYGPGMKSRGSYGSVMKVFLAQKANCMPFTVVGDGSQSRDFIYITDVVEAFIKAAESNVMGEVFNVGSGEPRTINELVKLLGGDIVHLPERPGEPDMTWADISKIKRMLGWEPKVTLEQGVKEMLAHLEDWKGETVWTPETIRRATKKWMRYLGGLG